MLVIARNKSGQELRRHLVPSIREAVDMAERFIGTELDYVTSWTLDQRVRKVEIFTDRGDLWQAYTLLTLPA